MEGRSGGQSKSALECVFNKISGWGNHAFVIGIEKYVSTVQKVTAFPVFSLLNM